MSTAKAWHIQHPLAWVLFNFSMLVLLAILAIWALVPASYTVRAGKYDQAVQYFNSVLEGMDKNAKAVLAELKKTFPPGLEYAIAFDSTTVVSTRILRPWITFRSWAIATRRSCRSVRRPAGPPRNCADPANSSGPAQNGSAHSAAPPRAPGRRECWGADR